MTRNIKSFLALILACLIPAMFLTGLAYHNDVQRAEFSHQQYTQLLTEINPHAVSSSPASAELPSFNLRVYGLIFIMKTASLALAWALVNILYIGIKSAFGAKATALNES